MLRVALPELGPIALLALERVVERSEPSRRRDIRWILMDERPVRAVDLELSTFWDPGDVGSPRHRALEHRLGTRFPDLEIETRAGLDSDPDAARALWTDGCDLVVLSPELVEPTRLWGQHRSFYGHGLNVLPVFVLGDFGWLGPLSRDGASPCLGCAYERVRAATGEDPWAVDQIPDPERVRGVAERLSTLLTEAADGRFPDRETLEFAAPSGLVRHPVLKAPHCAHCGSQGPFMPYRFAQPLALDEEPTLDPEQGILSLAEDLISPLTGPLIRATPVARADGEVDFEMWGAEVAEPGPDGRARVSAGAVAVDRERAQAATLGEALERAASRRLYPQDCFVASVEDLGGDAVPPAAFDVTDSEMRSRPDYPYGPVADDEPLKWVWGHRLSAHGGSRATAVPAAYVPAFRDPEDQIDFPVVSGFATATSYAEAAWRGFREVVERDAFMIAWANRLPLTGLRLGSSAPATVQERRRRFDAAGLEVRVAAVELDLGCVLVVAQCRSERPGDPATVLAAAADPDLERATVKALEEVAAARVYVGTEMQAADGILPPCDPSRVTSMGAHGLLYARREMRRELDAWWEPAAWRDIPPASPARSPGAELRRGVAHAVAAGLQVLVVDLTPPQIHRLGLRIVKTLVPGTYPMQFDSRWPHFGGSRMTETAPRLGLLPRALTLDELRRVPHPFP